MKGFTLQLRTVVLAAALAVGPVFTGAAFAQDDYDDQDAPSVSGVEDNRDAPSASGGTKEAAVNTGTKLGVRAGIHLTYIGALAMGYHFGAVRDVYQLFNFEILDNQFSAYVQPGVYFSTMNYGVYEDYGDGKEYEESSYWLEIPVLLSFRREPKRAENGKTAFRTELGPYVNIGLFGDFEVKDKAGAVLRKRSRFDVGLTWSAVAEYGPFWYSVSVSQGFITVQDDLDLDLKSLYIRFATLGVNF